jgi:hypothetical protein
MFSSLTHRHIGHIVYTHKMLKNNFLESKTMCPVCLCVKEKTLFILRFKRPKWLNTQDSASNSDSPPNQCTAMATAIYCH